MCRQDGHLDLDHHGAATRDARAGGDRRDDGSGNVVELVRRGSDHRLTSRAIHPDVIGPGPGRATAWIEMGVWLVQLTAGVPPMAAAQGSASGVRCFAPPNPLRAVRSWGVPR